ncbi:MAG: hypothetical protein PHF79_03355 [Candidatus Pacebacteria bacterium]|nr:hypothetical protein [Candidatus Paceibacterota bacterium]
MASVVTDQQAQTQATTTIFIAPSAINLTAEATTTATTTNSTTTATTVATSSKAFRNDETEYVANSKAVASLVKTYFKDIPLMTDIAYCESRDRQYTPDGALFRGKANNQDVGVFQVNEHYHLKRSSALGIDISTLEGNLRYARLLYTEQGSDPWISSSSCWKKSEAYKQSIGGDKLAVNTDNK